MTNRQQDLAIGNFLAGMIKEDLVQEDYVDLILVISTHFDPEDVFTFDQLEAWARDHNFITKEEVRE